MLDRLRGMGITILLVEQDAYAALKVADRGYVLETGRIVAEGTATELLHSDRVQRAYLGKGPMAPETYSTAVGEISGGDA